MPKHQTANDGELFLLSQPWTVSPLSSTVTAAASALFACVTVSADIICMILDVSLLWAREGWDHEALLLLRNRSGNYSKREFKTSRRISI